MIARLCTLTCGLIAAAGLSLSAHDPSAALRDAYKTVLDNAWVRVQRVHYAPHVKLPSHAHTEFAAAYVYLNDSGPVVFGHSGVGYGAVTRAATKAGMFRLYRAVKEMHEVENTSPLPSDFLRIEFKTEPLESALLRGRFERVVMPKGEQMNLQFENAQLRVTRFAIVDETVDIAAIAPALFVDTHTGKVDWVDRNGSYRIERKGNTTTDVLRFELKTAPQ